MYLLEEYPRGARVSLELLHLVSSTLDLGSIRPKVPWILDVDEAIRFVSICRPRRYRLAK